MKYLIIIATLFVIGSLSGWIIEVFFRRFVSQKKWMNPGFMVGPYLPIYGFGTVFLYALSNLPITTLGIANATLDAVLIIVIKILLIGVVMTLVELIAGLIFIRGMGIKLWDYSNRWGNFKGVICPAFSLIWLLVGAAYYFLLNGTLVNAIAWISEYVIYSFFIGIVIGMMVVDFAYSVHLATTLKKATKNLHAAVKFDEFKTYVITKHRENHHGEKKNFASAFAFLNNHDGLEKSVREFLESHKPTRKWWKKNKSQENAAPAEGENK